MLFSETHKLSELKELFQEISPINDGIIWLYHNKYMAKKLRSLQLNKPNLISCICESIEPIFETLKRIDKEKKNIEKQQLFLKKRNTFTDVPSRFNNFVAQNQKMTPKCS